MGFRPYCMQRGSWRVTRFRGSLVYLRALGWGERPKIPLYMVELGPVLSDHNHQLAESTYVSCIYGNPVARSAGAVESVAKYAICWLPMSVEM